MKTCLFIHIILSFLILSGAAVAAVAQHEPPENSSFAFPLLEKPVFLPGHPPSASSAGLDSQPYPPPLREDSRTADFGRPNLSGPGPLNGRADGQPGDPVMGDSFAGLAVSTGIIFLIFLGILYAGYRIGANYSYEAAGNLLGWLAAGHAASIVLLVLGVLYLPVRGGPPEPAFETANALLGIQIYLIFSSAAQAVSLFRDRPIPPVQYAHIFFAFVAILMTLVPGYRFLESTLLSVSIMYLPGVVLSLVTHQVTERQGRRDSSRLSRGDMTVSIPKGVPSSFPVSLLSRYHDVSVIGTGGLAVVYLATRSETDRKVAVKVPFSLDEVSGRTFLNEMSTWRELHHKNIVEVYDQNIYPVPYVEMEYLKRSLNDLTYPLSPGYAVSVTRDIAEALLYAHGKGIIHSDIKPGNVLLTDDGVGKLTDWGLSRSITRAEITKNTSFSLHYAAPEQLAPEEYGVRDERTDIYQLGVLLYEALCGQPPYLKQAAGEMFLAVRNNVFTLPSECSPVLAPFDRIVSRCLKPDPDERLGTMREFIACLDQVRDELWKP